MKIYEILPFFQGQRAPVKQVRIEEIQQDERGKRVKYPTPYLPAHVPRFVYPVRSEEDPNNSRATPPKTQEEQYFPLLFRAENEEHFFLFPYEPMINVTGGNHIIKRNLAKHEKDPKGYGSIKERWTAKDYEITITGALHGAILSGTVDDCFPREEFTKLANYLKGGRIEVLSPVFELLDIHYLVIEDMDFPFTKGENVQAYEIRARSDSSFQLLLDIDNEGNPVNEGITSNRYSFFE